MRKILILSALMIVLSGCGLKSSSDFSSLYDDHIHADIVAISDFAKALGLYKQEQSVGTLRAAVNVPMLMSGALSLEHDAKVNGRDADLSLKNVQLSYESMMGSGLLSFDKLGMISKESDLYVFFNGLKDENLLSEEIRSVLGKYTNTWLSWTQEDMRKTLSGASEEEILSNTIVENLSRMTLSDVEKYLKKYHLFKQTADLGMSGSLHIFAVDVDRDAVLSLIQEVTKDLTGTGISEVDQMEIQSMLASLSFSGTLGFDPKNSRTAETHLVIAESGSTQIGTLDAIMSETLTQIRVGSSSSNTSASFSLAKKDKRSELQLIVSENGTEMGKLSGYVEMDGEKFKELSLDATAQGMTVSLTHTMKDGGNFEGNLQLPIGNITWNGKIEGKRLTGISLKGTMPMGSLSMELVPKDGKISGPLVIKQGSDELFRADVTLVVDEGKFGVMLDVLSPDSKSPQAHVELDITAKSSPFTSSIGTPSPSKPLQDLINELEKIVPSDSFVPMEDDSGELEGANIQFDDIGSGELPVINN